MRVFQWSAADDGCDWWRLIVPGQVLTQLGHGVRHCRWAVASWVADSDVIVGQRVSNPGTSLRWREWRAKGKFLVFDVDDHLEALDPSSGEAFRFFNDAENRERLRANMRLADRVTAGTPRLADWASQYCGDVVVVPNGLPVEVLGWERSVRAAGGPVVVGWAGSIHTLPELAIVAPHLRTLLDRNPGRVVVHVVGVHPDGGRVRGALGRLGLDRPDVWVSPWVDPGFGYLRNVQGFDVWVAPYRSIPFNGAKVPTKAIEAACLGIPVVASNVGSYPAAVHHGQTGWVVKQDYLWSRYLQRLVDDVGLRQEMGAAARRLAVHHVVEGFGRLWERALTP